MASLYADLVATAYWPGPSVDEWLERVLDALCRYTGTTRGNAYSYTYEGGTLTLDPPVLHDVPTGFFDDSHRAMPPVAVEQLFTVRTRVSQLSREVPLLFEHDPFIRREFPRVGVGDMMALQSSLVSAGASRGCMVTVYLPERTLVGARLRRELESVARHLRVGVALRREGSGEEPVLARRKSADLRDLLRDVLAGRRAVVAAHDVDGERRFVVRPCDTSDPLALRPEERHVLELAARGVAGKAIAIDLGKVESVVSTLLARGMKKLGARTRTELVALLAAAR